MQIDHSAPVWRIAPGISVVRGALLKGGIRGFTGRIPEIPGVYAWHQSYDSITSHSCPRELMQSLEATVRAPHSVQRRARVGPAHEVTLSPFRRLGKEKQILTALENEAFADLLRATLSLSILFQAPLYVGKASKCLRTRATQHLDGSSGLLERLQETGVDLRLCSLLLVESGEPVAPRAGEDEDEGELKDESDDNEEPSGDELAFEEVLSKLFLPTFSIRYA